MPATCTVTGVNKLSFVDELEASTESLNENGIRIGFANESTTILFNHFDVSFGRDIRLVEFLITPQR